MKIGFTGTRFGMTDKQMQRLASLLLNIAEGNSVELHHGDCIGADIEAAKIAKQLGYKIVCHPPLNESDRGEFQSDEYRMNETYLKRNRNIVDECEILIATPKTATEQFRSGTWYTIRYAGKRNKKILIIIPDGTVNGESFEA